MSAGSHLVHIVLCFLTGLLWVPIYIICIISAGNSRKKKDRDLMERQTKALEEINRVNKWRGYGE